MTRTGWIATHSGKILSWSQGVYYKVNMALVIRPVGRIWNVWLRNTFTGDEHIMSSCRTKAIAIKSAQRYMRENPIGDW
jgi:hypothetical protein